ncbi:MAG: triose-phosphate isomerase [Candidatus Saccharibacteria bacterium]|nr:triose-phosphate isomerase [Candidatus Saccharibacteria bacterium]
MRKTMIAANWKMHLATHEASLLVHRLHQHIKTHRDIEIVLAPTMLTLQPLSLEIDRRRFRLAAQNAYFKDEGGFTGEVSFTMLRGLVHYAIIGHSERRIYFNESLEMIRDKVAAAIRNEIAPILCVGETKHERDARETRQVLHDQVTTALSGLTADEVSQVVIAYEPVWAISTFGGEIARPLDVAEALKFIRYEVSELYGQNVADEIRILYGGSVNEHTAGGYLALDDCDGALVGSASLNYHSFAAITDVAFRMSHQA